MADETPHVCDPAFKYRLYDARRIFVCNVCDKCVAEKKRGYANTGTPAFECAAELRAEDGPD
jgi:hypothetical protein